MELKQFDRVLIKTLYLLIAGIVVLQVMGISSLVSTLFTLTFPVTVFLWVRTVRYTVTGMDLAMVGAVALAFCAVLVDGCINGGSLSFSYLRKLIMFSMTLVYFQTAHRLRVDRDLGRFINRLVDLITLVLIAAYFKQHSQVYLLNGRISNYLTFGFTSPNLTAMFLVCLYMLELYRLFLPEKWYLELLHLGMAGFLVWFLLETRSRNCLLVLALFTAVCIFLVFRRKSNLRVSKPLAALVAAAPILFVAAYLLLLSQEWIQELFAFLVDEGKGLDARQKIWSNALNYLGSSPLIGAYCGISGGTGTSQMHNTHLDIATSYGIPVLICVCILLTQYLYQQGKRYTDKGKFIYILGFGCALMLGIGEAGLFSGGLGIYVLVGTFLLLANQNEGTSDLP